MSGKWNTLHWWFPLFSVRLPVFFFRWFLNIGFKRVKMARWNKHWACWTRMQREISILVQRISTAQQREHLQHSKKFVLNAAFAMHFSTTTSKRDLSGLIFASRRIKYSCKAFSSVNHFPFKCTSSVESILLALTENIHRANALTQK